MRDIVYGNKSKLWNTKENQKRFLDEVAKKLQLKKPNDWGKVTVRQVNKMGGGTLLTTYFNGSLFACLKSVYSGKNSLSFLANEIDIEWNKNWFSNLIKSDWKATENRKNFMDELALKLNIKSPKDWGKVRLRTIYEQGGGALLNKYYGGSLFTCLQSLYPSKYLL